jgi:hypothetical protein
MLVSMIARRISGAAAARSAKGPSGQADDAVCAGLFWPAKSLKAAIERQEFQFAERAI